MFASASKTALLALAAISLSASLASPSQAGHFFKDAIRAMERTQIKLPRECLLLDPPPDYCERPVIITDCWPDPVFPETDFKLEEVIVEPLPLRIVVPTVPTSW